MHDEPFDITAEIERLLELADDYRLGPSTAAIVAAVRKRRIPVLRITPSKAMTSALSDQRQTGGRRPPRPGAGHW